MPQDVTTLDAIALAWFLLAWTAYNALQDRRFGRKWTLNHHMAELRFAWMCRMLDRENRIVDSQFVGHTMNSVSFFASTTALVLAGLVGVLGSIETAYRVVSGLRFAVPASIELFEAKLVLLLAIFVHAFFKFTWSLRQYNYACALIGGAPEPPMAPELRDALARNIATVLTRAITSFNGGIRAYYFALAALTWFIQPWLFALATAWVLAVLLGRQVRSPSFEAIRAQRELLLPDLPRKARRGGA